MKGIKVLRPMVLWRFTLILLFLMAWLGVIAAHGGEVSVVTFYVY